MTQLDLLFLNKQIRFIIFVSYFEVGYGMDLLLIHV
jgi:hypothetical protein